jgi:hypothetical protein
MNTDTDKGDGDQKEKPQNGRPNASAILLRIPVAREKGEGTWLFTLLPCVLRVIIVHRRFRFTKIGTKNEGLSCVSRDAYVIDSSPRHERRRSIISTTFFVLCSSLHLNCYKYS